MQHATLPCEKEVCLPGDVSVVAIEIGRHLTHVLRYYQKVDIGRFGRELNLQSKENKPSGT